MPEGVLGHGRAPAFVTELLDGDSMVEVRREFGICRKTG
jgi:hypothetical protein